MKKPKGISYSCLFHGKVTAHHFKKKTCKGYVWVTASTQPISNYVTSWK